MKKYLPMHLFGLLKETAFLNNKALKMDYPDGYTSVEIMFEGSKNLPRKTKKKLRKLLLN
jgi:hypothetical protein